MKTNEKIEFEILKGLPPYGNPPITFSASGSQAFTEGLVVKFKNGETQWVGNFIGLYNGPTGVMLHPNGKNVIVVANGEGYIVDVDGKRVIENLSMVIYKIFDCEEENLILISDDSYLMCLGEKGALWTSEYLSPAGIEEVRIELNESGKKVVKGLCYCPTVDSDDWFDFELDFSSGKILKSDI